jgi:hypothetical protein
MDYKYYNTDSDLAYKYYNTDNKTTTTPEQKKVDKTTDDILQGIYKDVQNPEDTSAVFNADGTATQKYKSSVINEILNRGYNDADTTMLLEKAGITETEFNNYAKNWQRR